MSRPLQATIFGGTELARSQARTLRPQGFAAAPGTGPAGETCGTCLHCFRKGWGDKHWFKCELTRAKWSAERSTDILVTSPACERWRESPNPVKPKRLGKKRKPKARKSLPERLE